MRHDRRMSPVIPTPDPAPLRAAGPLPTFGFVTVHERPLADGVAQEAAWLAQGARTGRAAAHLWQGAPGLVVPRRYERLPRWHAACAAAAARGWPVLVRASGGGVVPQGPGVLNLSLVWPAPQASPTETEALYRALADELGAALARLGLHTTAQPVDGSFCDGRFNLAIDGRKCIGTAQAWRRVTGVPMVLLHAVIVVSADPVVLSAAANALEAEAGSDLRYRAEALVSLSQAWCAAHAAVAPPADFEDQVVRALAERCARIVPPRIHEPHPAASDGVATASRNRR